MRVLTGTGTQAFGQRRGEVEGAMWAPAAVALSAGPERPDEHENADRRSRVRDRRRSDADPDLAQLALDPNAAPAGVLPGEPEDERTDRGIDPWPASATGLAVCPLTPHELGMHRRRVAGVTRKATQRSRGMTRLAAARMTRRRLTVILPSSAGQVRGEHGCPSNDGDDQAGLARPGELRL